MNAHKEGLIKLIREDNWMLDILKKVRALHLHDWWICAGFVRSKIWDHIHEFSERTPLPDSDVIYYDAQQTEELLEKRWEAELNRLDPHVPWSVKNQARMHHLNQVKPYQSSTDAIAKFPETATALGVTLDENNKIKIAAPHGLEDVYHGIIKPTVFFKETAERMEVYEQRIQKKQWHMTWPNIFYNSIV